MGMMGGMGPPKIGMPNMAMETEPDFFRSPRSPVPTDRQSSIQPLAASLLKRLSPGH